MRTKRKRGGIPFHVRLPARTIEKLGWLAAEKGFDRAAMARVILADGVKGAKPPVEAKTLVIQANSEQRESWEQLAGSMGVTIEQLAAGILDKMAARAIVGNPDSPRRRLS